jgi:hypothetical protein
LHKAVQPPIAQKINLVVQPAPNIADATKVAALKVVTVATRINVHMKAAARKMAKAASKV